jgi:maltose alpha-D-glucosyltransferase/alpha-amylase
MNDYLWYKDAIFYELNVRAFKDSNADGHGDLPGLAQKLDYLKDLGVNCLWLLPIYPSPLNDDGYDISDYYNVYPGYGTLQDFKQVLDEAHARGIRVITDLVLNHTSDQHPWFQADRSDPDSPYHEYYVWSDTDQKYQDARIIFLDTESSNWAWDEKAGKYYWHRFYSTQPDLNFDNPAVQQEMLNIMRFWLDMGVDGFRADAVPYLFERDGTNCENLPETHAYLKVIRSFINENYPGRILLAEANQWPEDVLPYFGDGTNEFHMGFHFPLMPRIFMALKKGDRRPIEWVMRRTPPLKETCQWCVFLRNHDELTLEMVTEEERQWMWEKYAPEPRMRLNLGIRRRLAPLLDNDRRKIELANSLLFSMPGSPIIYYGDEIGMGDDIWLFDRNGVRTPMQWDGSENAGFSQAPADQLYSPVISDETFGYQKVNVAEQLQDAGSLLNFLGHMIEVRKQHPAFGRGTLEWVQDDLPDDRAVLAVYLRADQNERLLIVNNLSSTRQEFVLTIPGVSSAKPVDILHGSDIPGVADEKLRLSLDPYRFLWLKL